MAAVHVSTPLVDLTPLLHDPRVWVVVVDAEGVLAGVMSHETAVQAVLADPEGWVTDHMHRTSIALDAEAEIAEAAAVAAAHRADHVVVVSARGELLGIVSSVDLARERDQPALHARTRAA